MFKQRSTGLMTIVVAGLLLAGASLPVSAQEIRWRLQANLGTGEPGYESVRVSFVEALEKMSNGRIKIQMHPVGALFPVQEGLEAVGNGVVEMALSTGGYFTGKLGPIGTFESGLPGAERTAMERYTFFYSKGFIDIAREAYAKHNVYYLAPHLSPEWSIIAKKPISSAADFKGLKIRTFGIEAQWYASMGASPVMLGGGELHTALSTGVVDAVRWGSPAVIHKLGLHEAGKFLIQPAPLPAPNNNFLINQDAWNKLPADLKAMFAEAAKLASLDYVARGAELDAVAIRQMNATGVKVVRIPDAEWLEMEKKARAIWADYAKQDPGLTARAVKLLQDYLAELGR
jgi:TRAP-type mannitol/chloroaromatic compound transport system substrate-binding protein